MAVGADGLGRSCDDWREWPGSTNQFRHTARDRASLRSRSMLARACETYRMRPDTLTLEPLAAMTATVARSTGPPPTQWAPTCRDPQESSQCPEPTDSGARSVPVRIIWRATTRDQRVPCGQSGARRAKDLLAAGVVRVPAWTLGVTISELSVSDRTAAESTTATHLRAGEARRGSGRRTATP